MSPAIARIEKQRTNARERDGTGVALAAGEVAPMDFPTLSVVSTLLAMGLAAACSGDDSGKADNSPGGAVGSGGSKPKLEGGTAASNATGGASASGGTNGDASCGAMGISIEAIPPNMMVIFDRSCSMRRLYSDPTAFGTGPDDPGTRWATARNALEQIMNAYDKQVRFGLLVFPRPLQGCGDVPVVNVEPELLTKGKILDVLHQSDVQPFDVCAGPDQPHETPTAEALTAVLQSGLVADPTRENYVLLMTDGAASCYETAPQLAELVSQLSASGVKTAVVGFGDVEVPEAVEALNAEGQAGGLKTGGPPWYWLAQQPQDLQTAIGTVVETIISCSFKLKDAPPDPSKLYAYFDGSAVPNDGWTYDPSTNTLSFHGSACSQLQAGSIKNVSVVFGCPDSTCVPAPEVCDGYDNNCDGQVDETCPA